MASWVTGCTSGLGLQGPPVAGQCEKSSAHNSTGGRAHASSGEGPAGCLVFDAGLLLARQDARARFGRWAGGVQARVVLPCGLHPSRVAREISPPWPWSAGPQTASPKRQTGGELFGGGEWLPQGRAGSGAGGAQRAEGILERAK